MVTCQENACNFSKFTSYSANSTEPDACYHIYFKILS